MSDTLATLVRKKKYSDVYYLYEIAGTSGDPDKKEYPAYDLGIYRGYIDPKLIYNLASDGTEDGGTWTDYTTEGISAASSAFTAIRLADVEFDAMYVGAPFKFTGMSVDMGVAGVDGGTLAATWEYPNAVTDLFEPSAWYDLNEEDNTASAADKGLDAGTSTYTVEWEVPKDWVLSNINSTDTTLGSPENKLYWVKFMVGTAGYSTAPTIERIRLVRPLPATSLTILESLDDDCD